MFRRFGELKIITAAYDQPTLSKLKQEWHEIVKQSGTFCAQGSCPFVAEDSFAYDPENFIYYRARAITADMANGNGDRFPFLELESAYKTFRGTGVYLNHDSDSPDKSFGLVLDAVLHKPINQNAYVEILAAIDKDVAEQKHSGIVRKITNGILNSTSMGCSCAEALCSICDNRARTQLELCAHMHPESREYCKGRKNVQGSIIYEDNYGITFTEDSVVSVPADPTARMFEIFAKLSKEATLEQIKDYLSELSKLVCSLEKTK
jgi:hypothetical protein